MKLPPTHWKNMAWVLVPMLLSFLWCMVYGRLGLNPLDSGIVFDGAVRLNQGQDFFVDFHTPAGFTPIVLQAFFFKLFGTNWLAYALHAALFNALFAGISYRLLRLFDLPRPYAALYAFFSGLVFYPPFGAPYPDQHAFFFSLLAVLLLVEGSKLPAAWWPLVLVGPTLLLAGLSKQVPSGYVALLIPLLLLLGWPMRKWGMAALKLAAGLPLAGIILLLLFDWGEVNVDEAWYYFWEMPGEMGNARVAELGYGTSKLFRAVMLRQIQGLCGHGIWHQLAVYWLPVVAFLAVKIWQVWQRRSAPGSSVEGLGKMGLGLATAYGLLAAGGGFVLLTQNQQQNGLALVFVALGLVHACYLLFSTLLRATFPRHLKSLRIATWVFSILLLGHATWDAFSFQQTVVASRMVHDFPEGESPHFKWPWQSDQASAPGLAYLHWDEPYFDDDRNPAPLIAFLQAQNQAFFLWGDLQFIHGLLGQPSPLPSLWLHEGLTIPPVGSPYRTAWDQQLLQNLESIQPRYLIFELPEGNSYMEERLEAHPAAWEWIEERKGIPLQVGGYYLWELSGGA